MKFKIPANLNNFGNAKMRFYLPTRTFDNIDVFENDLGTSLFFKN